MAMSYGSVIIIIALILILTITLDALEPHRMSYTASQVTTRLSSTVTGHSGRR